MKQLYLTSIIFLVTYLFCGAQSANVVLSSSESGVQVHQATNSIQFSTGYSYSPDGGTMIAEILQAPDLPDISGSVTYNSTPIDPDTYGIDTSLPLSAFCGNLSINGAASYTVPIEAPKGLNGIQPDINLNYSGSLSDGLAGIGWNIGGLSEISLIAPDYYHDGITAFSNNYLQYKYELDGGRLILTDGDFGTSGSSYQPEIDNSLLVEAVGSSGIGPQSFIAYSKEGLIYEYGATSDSRLMLDGSSIMVWKLSKITDRQGNYISFEYFTTEQELPIKKIEYGGNTNAGSDCSFKIYFSYKSRGKTYRFIRANTPIDRTVLLDQIEVLRNGVRYRRYTCSYTNTANMPILERVDKYSSSNVQLNPIVFSYSAGSSQMEISSIYSNSTKKRIFQGDINGDGRTDIVTLPTLDDTSLNPVLTVYLGTASGTLQYGWQMNIYDNFTECYITDLNADGKSDLLLIRYEVDEYVVYPYLSSGTSFAMPSGTSYWSIEGNYDQHKVVDFNGDGIKEILYYTSAAGSYFLYSYLGEQVVPPSIKSATGIAVEGDANEFDYYNIDFDGDGCTDILVVSDTGYSIYQFKGEDGKPILTDSGNDITNEDNICVGDFNGDGLTDLILSSRDSSPGWTYIYYTKNGLKGKLVSGLPSSINMTRTVTRCESCDINGDGKTDLIFWNNSKKIFVGLNLGNGYEYSWTEYTSPVSFDMAEVSQSVPLYYAVGDYDGNGRDDFLYSKPGSEQCFSFESVIPENFLTTIIDGTGIESRITYKPMTDQSVYSSSWSSSTTYPIYDYRSGIPLVRQVEISNGVGGTNVKYYRYFAAKMHSQGKGFLGFSATTITDSATGMRTENYFQFDSNFFLPTIDKCYLYYGEDDDPINYTTYVWDVVDLGNNRCFPYISSSVFVDNLTGLSTSESCLYEKPNSTSKYLVLTENTKGYGSGNYVETEYSYDNDLESNWLIGRPTNITTTSVRGADTQITTLARSYFSTNNLPDVDSYNSGDESAWELDRDYDVFGNITKEKISTANLTTKTTEYIFDAQNGIELDSIVDPLGRKTSFTYFPATGLVKLEMDPYGNSKSYCYNNADKLSFVEPSNGIVTNYSYSLDVSDGPTYASYYIEQNGNDGSYGKTWYDLLGREIRKETKNFAGYLVKADRSYNSKGLVTSISEPSTGTPSKWTSIQYDKYGRIQTKTPYFGAASSYSYVGATTKETVNGRLYTTLSDAAGLVTKRTDPAGSVAYSYFGNGTLESTKVLNTVVTSFSYDKNGNRKTIDDPSAGLLQNTWYGTGQLHTTTNADGEVTTNVYLANGLLDYYIDSGGRKVDYSYNSDQLVSNITITETGRPTVSQSYTYETGRVKTITESIESVTNIITYDYDDKGRLWKKYYNGTTDYEQYFYNTYGYLYLIQFNGSTVWRLTSMDVYGRELAATIGSTSATWGYDANNMLSQIKATGVQQYDYNFDASTGNLNSRANTVNSLSETFGYDSSGLDRLTTVTGSIAQTIGYNTNGNILNKSDAGTTYAYDETPYAVSSIENYQNISTTDQVIDYYSFEKVKKITEGNLTADFEYNANNQRIRMVLKNNGTETKTRWYFAGNVEREKIGSTTYDYIWIGGDAYTAVAVAKRTGTGAWTVYNIFRDHLGTITHLKTGSTITEYSFDAWGRRRDKDDWTYTLTSEPTLFADRGFTAHEYLEDFKLYNMNGRMYDPVVGRFLNPDPAVQAPGFTQSFNRYSYCLNNPLKFTDPSGNKWKWKWLNPMHWFSEGMQWVNDNTEGVRNKMSDIGIPDFSVGTSINMAGNVNFNGSYRGQEVFNSENVDRSNAVQVVNQAINQTRQTYGQEWWEASNGGITSSSVVLPTISSAASVNINSINLNRGRYIFSNTVYAPSTYIVRTPLFNMEVSAKLMNRTGKVLKWGNRIMSAYTAFNTVSDPQLSNFEKTTEITSQGLSTFLPGYYGVAWNVGWEGGRSIVNTSAYQYWKRDFLYNIGIIYTIPLEFRRSAIEIE
ncbi:FG-GAP-like repeat-containing protein [Mangrovibacterium diazotrophicum]|uniref:RHS repeat-associated protein n=1 Tax=Mangrovibacterium diazotrophicum TaxID=1261403 RepID=A0A419WB55_9BACT|nr:FG-GAP-like repeat-containing protein [Mangrovibacterium diazotrophicum]RKD92654.1 RHS repeat-associated protein [Mangrovibacterium diazotrophicum]